MKHAAAKHLDDVSSGALAAADNAEESKRNRWQQAGDQARNTQILALQGANAKYVAAKAAHEAAQHAAAQRAVSQTDSLPVKAKPAIAYAVDEVRAARFSAAAAAAAEAAANQQVDANATPLPTLVKALPTPKTVPPPLALGPPPKAASHGYKPPPAALQESGCTKAP